MCIRHPAAGAIALAAALFACEAPAQDAVTQVEFPRRAITLPPVGLADFATVGAQAKSMRGANVRATAAGDGLVATAPLAVPFVDARVERRIDGLYRLPGGFAKQGASRTRVFAESLTGEPGVFTCRDDPRETIPVTVRELPPRVLGKGEDAVTEGSVLLEFGIESLRRTGVYAGRLVVRVESF